MKCDVCKERDAISVNGSATGAISLAYCEACLHSGREPYGAVVASLLGMSSMEDVAEWYRPIIRITLKAEDKSVEELFADVAVFEKEITKMGDILSASEAIYGFAGWLTSRPERTVMSETDCAATIANLVDIFCRANHLDEPRGGWSDNLIHPDDAAQLYGMAVIPEPTPEPGVGDIAELVKTDIEARVEHGEMIYGTRLQAFNKRDALTDAYQEALDLVLYLRQVITEIALREDDTHGGTE